MVTGVRGSDRITAASQAGEGGQQRGQYKHRVGHLNVVFRKYILLFVIHSRIQSKSRILWTKPHHIEVF